MKISDWMLSERGIKVAVWVIVVSSIVLLIDKVLKASIS